MPNLKLLPAGKLYDDCLIESCRISAQQFPASLQDGSFSRCSFEAVDFSDCALSSVHFEHCEFRDCSFSSARLTSLRDPALLLLR